jgi:hypothetical protein
MLFSMKNNGCFKILDVAEYSGGAAILNKLRG